MNLGRALASFVRDQRIFETTVIQTNRFGRLRKQVDDRRAAEAERAFVDDEVFRRAAVEEHALVSLSEELRVRLREWLFAEGQESMEEVVGRLLSKQQRTVALAESCTGGLIGHRLTQVPGSSSYMDRGVICYSNRAKVELLGVPPELIERHGAVSAEVAAAMAKGVRERSGVSVGLSVTGIAGPGGGTAAKPVGLVYIGLNADDGASIVKEHRFHGDRSVIKLRSSQAALDLLRRWLLAAECR